MLLHFLVPPPFQKRLMVNLFMLFCFMYFNFSKFNSW